MVTESELTQAIYDKYILPTEREVKRSVGIELEYPIVNLHGATDTDIISPVDFDVVHRLAEDFVREFGFDNITRDENNEIYNAVDSRNGDVLSFDCSYNTLELSFGVEEDINIIYDRFIKYYTYIQGELGKFEHTLTGMGINLGYKINKVEPIANGRYRMLLRHLQSYTKYGNAIEFHNFPHFGLFSCASQVQLDVGKDELVETLNTFTRLEPLKAYLLANSVFKIDDYHKFLASRDYLWKHSLHGMNPHNVDDYTTVLHSIDEVVSYIKTMSLYCIDRDGKYINFEPTRLDRYISSESINGEYYSEESGRVETITFEPRLEDLEFLRSFKFNDLTYRGTVEFRSVCEQPVSDVMASAAFHAGLKERLHDLTALLQDEKDVYQQGYSIGELRKMFTMGNCPGFINQDYIKGVLKDVLDISKQGLKDRGLNEEHFLDPLYERAEAMTNPALEYIKLKKARTPVSDIVKKYSDIK